MTRLVWILVDGLRLDASREMPVLNRLRAEGADVSAKAEVPTYSGPNFVAQASGLEPAASGVLTNGYAGEVALDSVFRRAKLAGLRTAVVTTDHDRSLSRTYASWTDQVYVGDDDLHLPAADLVLAHIGYVDRAAHQHGAASGAYRAAVARADDVIGRIARTLDPAHETLVVTSDHGHLDDGGHGGTERAVVRIPFVLWGAGVVPGPRSGRGRDVGPTIASVLGVGPLSHATGHPLFHGDAAAAHQRAAVRAVLHGATAPGIDYLPMAISLAVLGLLVIVPGARIEIRLLLAAPTYAVVFAGLLLATHTLSFSVSNDTVRFGIRVTTLSAIAAVAQLSLGGRPSFLPAALVAVLAALGTMAVAARQQLAPVDGTLLFLPIPTLAALAFVCLATATVGTWGRVRDRSSLARRDDVRVRAVPTARFRGTEVAERRTPA